MLPLPDTGFFFLVSLLLGNSVLLLLESQSAAFIFFQFSVISLMG